LRAGASRKREAKKERRPTAARKWFFLSKVLITKKEGRIKIYSHQNNTDGCGDPRLRWKIQQCTRELGYCGLPGPIFERREEGLRGKKKRLKEKRASPPFELTPTDL
jgi:hypothetical protein